MPWPAATTLADQSVVNGVNTSPYLALTPAVAGDVPNDHDVALANEEKLRITQLTATFDVMPSDHVTFRFEYGHRTASMSYFAGRGGVTSPNGWNAPIGDPRATWPIW